MEPSRRPASKPGHTFLQFGGLSFVVFGTVLNLAGLINLFVASSHGAPPRLLILSIIGLPLLVIGFAMMALGFTAAARRYRQLAPPRE